MPSTATLLERLLPGCRAAAGETLRSSDRTVVQRAQLTWPGGDGPDRVIVKRFLQPEGFASEAAALSVLPPGLPAPRMVAEDRALRVIVMTDVGRGPSLADALLGGRAGAVQPVLHAWADALAALHRATLGLQGPFGAAVADRGGDEATVAPMARWLDAAPLALQSSAADLAVGADVHEEVRSLTALLGDRRWAALSQGDSCPDNNVRTRAGLYLIDFEEAAVRHVAWDLAYLRVPWPSCWCAWDLPASSAETTIAHYADAMTGTPIGADPSALRHAVELATLGFALVSAAWFLPSALQRDDTLGTPGQAAPSRRAAVLHRVAVAADTAAALGYPATAAAARSWHRSLERRWGARLLPVAPALR